MARKSFAAFCQAYPCLEEIDGFRQQRMSEDLWTGTDQEHYLKYKRDMEAGKIIPGHSKLPRQWKYKKGKPVSRPKGWSASA